MVRFKGARGFTIIELLVVVAIIGILATLILVSLSGVRAKARDAVRKSDLSQVKRALEIYNADNGSYPATIYDTTTGPCAGTSGGICSPTTAYMKRTPSDPLATSSQYQYVKATSGALITDFALAGDLEDENAGATLTIGTATAGAGTGVYACATNCAYAGGASNPGKWYQTSND